MPSNSLTYKADHSTPFQYWLSAMRTGWAEREINGTTTGQRFARYLTGNGYDQCEICLKRGEWLVSDICCWCHRFICAECARLHHKMDTAICHGCYEAAYLRYLDDTARYGRRGALTGIPSTYKKRQQRKREQGK